MSNSPFVMCLTNTVAANFTANVLLAIGAKPAMIEDADEAAELAAVSDAVLVNVGTLTQAQAETMRAAIRVCRARRIPWVLDPVAIQALSFRRTFVIELLNERPTIIRANAAEMAFLLGSVPMFSGSVPTLSSLETNEIDTITDGNERFSVSGGVPMLQDVTATGCAQGAICAAFLGWGQTPREACLSASRLMKQAGERAFERAQTPGSFQIALIDALYELSPIRR